MHRVIKRLENQTFHQKGYLPFVMNIYENQKGELDRKLLVLRAYNIPVIQIPDL